jgi:hypothetical protein
MKIKIKLAWQLLAAKTAETSEISIQYICGGHRQVEHNTIRDTTRLADDSATQHIFLALQTSSQPTK